MKRGLVQTFIAGGLLAIACFGCGPEFQPYWKIDRLRVLAVKADPVVADEGDAVTLSALVKAPGDPEIEYDWSWCPVRLSADSGYECPVDAEEIGEQFEGGEGEQVPEDLFDLGEEPSATFVNFMAEEDVRQFCEQLTSEFTGEDSERAELLPDIDCREGWEVSVRLEVSTADDSLIASKRFTLSGGAEEQNENPEFADYQIRPEQADDLSILRDQAGWEIPEDADRQDQWLTVPADEDVRVVEGVDLELRALVDPESVQTYTPGGQDEPREEALEYRHFTTAGAFSSSEGLYAPDSNTLEEASNVTLTLSPDRIDEECTEPVDGGCRVGLWTVVRDARLGLDWIERHILVQPGDEE